jgi:hypothetical protein
MTIPFEIRNRWTNAVQVTAQIDCAPDAPQSVKLGLAVQWAVKERADLRGANLCGAKLCWADLCGAKLNWADLRETNLRGADLSEANMREANLSMAKNIDSMVMPDGLTFADYKRDVVPALLTAGGKTLDEIREAGAWDCHEWSNCPMHVAFGVNHTSEMVGPFAIYRQRAYEFIQFFDAGLIPAPWEPVAALARLEDTHD